MTATMTPPVLINESEVRAAISAQPITSREPAVLTGIAFGVVTSVATALAQAQTATGINWWSLAPALVIILLSVLIRFGVVSPARAQAIQDLAAQVGAQAAAAAPAIIQLAPGTPIDELAAALNRLGVTEISNPDVQTPPSDG